MMNGIVYVASPGDPISEGLQDLGTVLQKGSWVSLVVTWYQPTINSTAMAPNPTGTVNDTVVASLVSQCKGMGLNTMLKPHVDLSADPTHWRGQIGAEFNRTQWDLWFEAYSAYIAHMCTVAQELEVDIVNIGTELTATQGQESSWRNTIALCRKVFHGPIVYGANHGDAHTIGWWDALDFIGIDAYYSLTNKHYPTVKELVSGWSSVVDNHLKPLVSRWNKTILFTEVGYQSTSAAAITPWAAPGNLSLATQANAYVALYESLNRYIGGVFWWAWSSQIHSGGPRDTGFSMHNKPSASAVSWRGQWN